MRKFGIFALVLALTGVLCACNRSDKVTQETTGVTMPTIITTEPHVNDTIPGTTFRPDEDGMIAEQVDSVPVHSSQCGGRRKDCKCRYHYEQEHNDPYDLVSLDIVDEIPEVLLFWSIVFCVLAHISLQTSYCVLELSSSILVVLEEVETCTAW